MSDLVSFYHPYIQTWRTLMTMTKNSYWMVLLTELNFCELQRSQGWTPVQKSSYQPSTTLCPHPSPGLVFYLSFFKVVAINLVFNLQPTWTSLSSFSCWWRLLQAKKQFILSSTFLNMTWTYNMIWLSYNFPIFQEEQILLVLTAMCVTKQRWSFKYSFFL